MRKQFIVMVMILWTLIFILAANYEPPKELPKASAFNAEIKARNQGDERATFYDKQTVRNILKQGCLPVIPKDTNQNITSLCSHS